MAWYALLTAIDRNADESRAAVFVCGAYPRVARVVLVPRALLFFIEDLVLKWGQTFEMVSAEYSQEMQRIFRISNKTTPNPINYQALEYRGQ